MLLSICQHQAAFVTAHLHEVTEVREVTQRARKEKRPKKQKKKENVNYRGEKKKRGGQGKRKRIHRLPVCFMLSDVIIYFFSHCPHTQVLLSSLLACTAAAKKARLKCLRYVVEHVPVGELSKLTLGLLTDVLLCVKEVALKARQEAFRIVVALGQRFVALGQPLGKLARTH